MLVLTFGRGYRWNFIHKLGISWQHVIQSLSGMETIKYLQAHFLSLLSELTDGHVTWIVLFLLRSANRLFGMISFILTIVVTVLWLICIIVVATSKFFFSIDLILSTFTFEIFPFKQGNKIEFTGTDKTWQRNNKLNLFPACGYLGRF